MIQTLRSAVAFQPRTLTAKGKPVSYRTNERMVNNDLDTATVCILDAIERLTDLSNYLTHIQDAERQCEVEAVISHLRSDIKQLANVKRIAR